MIRFAGLTDEFFGPSGLCVGPGFACGRKPTIPPRYTSNPACVIIRGRWTFIDAATDACKDAAHREFGFYVAVWGAGEEFGLLEAVPKGRLAGVSLRRFADDVMARNVGRSFGFNTENRYTMFGNNEIRFAANSGTPIRSTGIAALDAIFSNAQGLAAGTVLNTSGDGAAMTIRNAGTGELLLFDLSDQAHPARILFEPDPLRRLLGRGIVFSVSEDEIREWLGNIYTPYPALAAAIERDFPDGGLARPLDIDVVRWFYEEGQAAPSPRRIEDVDRQLLESALISAHNSRYGERITRIEQIRRGPPAPVPARAPMDEAFDIVARFNRTWSQANAVAMHGIEPMYAASIDYYGESWSREKVLEEKRKFAARWPVRDYHFRPDSKASSCDPAGACLVNGTVEWYAAAPARNAVSVGSSEVSIGVAKIDGAFVIMSEDSHVTGRLSWP